MAEAEDVFSDAGHILQIGRGFGFTTARSRARDNAAVTGTRRLDSQGLSPDT